MKPKAQPPTESSRVFWRWVRAIAIVALIVVGCYASVKALTPKVRDPGPDEIKARMADGSLELDQAVEQINKLDARDRRGLMQSPEAQGYYQSLAPQQRLDLLRRTLDRGIQQQIERYRKMNKDEREEFIADAQSRQAEAREQMSHMSESERKDLREMVNSSDLAVVVEKAVKAYLAASSSEERAELAPLFEGALDNLNYAKGL